MAVTLVRSRISETGGLGNTIKIKALSRELDNPGWTVSPVRCKLLFMEDLDDIQFQPILQGIADDTVIPLGVDNQANLQNNRVRITNSNEWSQEQKHRIVEIDPQERRKGKSLMKRIKTRWDLEFPELRRMTQNLVDNAKRFKKKGLENIGKQEESIVEPTTPDNNSKQLNWTTEMKIDLVTMDTEKRAKRRGFMMKVKERWEKVSRIPSSKLAETKRKCSSKNRKTATGSGKTTRGRGRA